MLTLYRQRKSSDSEESEKDTIIPPGRPYLTKVNGKLVMAREKKPRVADIAIDLLGEAFGSRTLVRRRSKSLEQPKTVPMLLTGPAYQPQLPYSAPILQQPFQPFTPYRQLSPGCLQSFAPYQPSGGPQSFILYQPSQSYLPGLPSMQPVQEPQRYTVPPSKLTVKDFELLREIDAHYNNEINSQKTKRLSAGPAPVISEEVITTKTTIMITKHICANCGRLRSRKYHAENPIKAGGALTPAFCRKCQKDSSETSDSGGGPKKRDKKKSKNRDEKNSESLSEDEPSHSSELKKQKYKSKKSTEGKRVPSKEYIVVEEEFSGDERPDHRRQYLRIQDSDIGRSRSRSRSRQSHQESQYTEDKIVQEPLNDSPRYEYEPTQQSQQPRRGRRPKLSRSEEDIVKRSAPNESFTVPERTIGREDSFDSVTSQRSAESRRRRRVERANPNTVPAAPWNEPHIFHPRPRDETVIVTERYVYKPKRHMEEQRRQQEYNERASYTSENRSADLNDEASQYYHNDWSKEEVTHAREYPARRDLIPGRYRRDSVDSELAESESTDYFKAYDAVFHDIPPRAPSPPSPAPAAMEPWPEIPQDSLSPKKEFVKPTKATHKGKGRRKDSPRRRRRRGSSANANSSNYYSPFAREASDGPAANALIPSPQGAPRFAPADDNRYYDDVERERGGTEKALVPSPRKHRHRAPSYEGDDDDYSNMTERERIVERETKRVTFRDPTPSPGSVSSAYSARSDRSESFLKRKTSWDESALGGGGGSEW